ncbi:uncharacterized protein ARMOST_14253 [Armillaria ostoyae]|uniref:Uncharacterized protein n=1 Tax=Armillaria ostoyae TaxID=47428 RepID=A0A284RQ54_ARMOS|nr:uncharacterized protein ARMOST_14253 [Armillaria ostoyae]
MPRSELEKLCSFFDAPAVPRKLAPLTKEQYWKAMNTAVESWKLGKVAMKPEILSQIKSALYPDEDSLKQYVLASPGNMGGETEMDTRYNGPSTWDFMSLDIDMANGSTQILKELEHYCLSFGPSMNSQALRHGLREMCAVLEKLERLADWIDDADLMQWSKAEAEHQCLWKGWKKFVERSQVKEGSNGNSNS